MQSRSMMLGGAGLAAIASALFLAATPAAAQMGHYGTMQNQYPTTPQPLQGQYGTMQNRAMSKSGQPLSTVTDASTTLASATVQDSSGQSVGQVKSVNTSSVGTARSVAVSLTSGSSSGKVVTIKADKLTFDPTSNVVKASLTLEEISQLPTTTQSSP